MTRLVEEIAERVYRIGSSDCQCENCTIDRSIRVTIEAMAQEAEENGYWAISYRDEVPTRRLSTLLRDHLTDEEQ